MANAVLLLAAGMSKRLGEPKQLVLYQNKPLLWHAAQTALKLSKNVYVLLGHQQEACEEALKDLAVHTLYNPNFAKGIGASLAFGFKHLNHYERTLVMLCDQPFIPLSHYQKLLNTHGTVASFYANSVGVPAVFTKEHYCKLLTLNADKGAKKLLQTLTHKTVILSEDESLDIDTQTDVKTLLKQK